MIFKFTADIEFEADGIDSAFLALENHFNKLAETDEDVASELPWFVGKMELRPKE